MDLGTRRWPRCWARSRNSSKPPAGDGPARLPKSLRGQSGKKPGGQAAHPGAHRTLVDTPDQVVVAHPAVCGICQEPLTQGVGVGMERRQVSDVPPMRPMITEYQGRQVQCSSCHAITTGCSRRASRRRCSMDRGRGRSPCTSRSSSCCPMGARGSPHRSARLPRHGGNARRARAGGGQPFSIGGGGDRGSAAGGIAAPQRRNGPVRRGHELVAAQREHGAAHPLRRPPQTGAEATDALGILAGFAGTSVHDGWAP